MVAIISFFPVDDGDMTLLRFESERSLLVDINIRDKSDENEDDTPDVATMLRDRLKTDAQGRLYVDAFLLSHPDLDHCNGLRKHFHLGPPEDYPAKSGKIFIREIWSSPIVFRRASKNHSLCKDAGAFNAEARRRVAKYRSSKGAVNDGDRILILGEDEGGKTDDLGTILIKIDDVFSKINGALDSKWSARLLAPFSVDEIREEEESLTKNKSSTILQITIGTGNKNDACRYLTGGDAEVVIWEKLWRKHKKKPEVLSYDMLLTPHHCSWHSLSYDSWSKTKNPQVNRDARSALAQTRDKAVLMSSSRPIKDDGVDPPCVGAKREYEGIANNAGGEFLCVMEECDRNNPGPIEFEVGLNGPKRGGGSTKGGPILPAAFKSSSDRPPEVDKRGGGRYA